MGDYASYSTSAGALLGIAKQDGDELDFSWLTEDDGELDKGADINESLI